MKTFLRNFGIKLLVLTFIMPVMSLALVSPAVAVPAPDDGFFGIGNDETVGDVVTLGEQDPRTIAANVINIILGFLGLIAVIIILAGGFKWMTAGGNQDKVDEAKKLITAGIIGLVIILASFGIATFVLNSLISATASV